MTVVAIATLSFEDKLIRLLSGLELSSWNTHKHRQDELQV
jgi:hypothetical protein